jgi:hypothetical protein
MSQQPRSFRKERSELEEDAVVKWRSCGYDAEDRTDDRGLRRDESLGV